MWRAVGRGCEVMFWNIKFGLSNGEMGPEAGDMEADLMLGDGVEFIDDVPESGSVVGDRGGLPTGRTFGRVASVAAVAICAASKLPVWWF